ncbi:uncharacterized protein A4U43_C04F24960 [Asparagus officinalis]|uniref:non-specific serine/threonine protein kinase n=1 Tax=Asparagus officinalis TaxID=4686 RepID=A0A5P1F594_ASPOF|nr:uncharacterized protein A4U43_C04F24960 [Asparagus officinalis]
MVKIFILILSLLPLGSLAISNGASRDREALIAFGTGITADPSNALANWGSRNSDACNWTGVTCHKTKWRVVKLVLSDRNLRGVISPALANLSFLSVLDLSVNYFYGEVPTELGALSRLKELSLTTNLLRGSIPAELGLLKKLVYLDVGSNRLTGPVPKTLLCNCSSLQYVDLSNNSLAGKIAISDKCRLNDLKFLLLWLNNFDGPIPTSLSNYSTLAWIDFESNYLSGELPSEIFNKMPYLQYLHLSYNNFSSFSTNTNFDLFFTSLSNSTHLQELELAGNNLRGVIPSSIGDISASLQQIHLEDNLLYGPIPAKISNLVNLTYLNLSNNFLNGSIPSDISKLRRLERFYLSNNLLSGEIPPSLGQIPHLGLVDISRNMLSGSIPDTLSNLAQLRRLMLHNNQLSGTIPSSLGNCINLEILDLSYNQLSGEIPSNVAELMSLKLYLNLSSNFLSGPLPTELSKMNMIMALDLSSNNFSGSIPPQLGICIALEYLNLSFNSLQGPLPNSIGALPYLKSLDLSSNKLTGTMPKSLQTSSTLKQLNASFNNFSGIVPSQGVFATLSKDSFIGNTELCSSILGISPCTHEKAHHFAVLPMVLTLIASSSCMMCLFAYPLVLRSRRRSQALIMQHSRMRDDNERSTKEYPRIHYWELEKATEGFSESNIIGAGRFGQVYKGILSDEMRIAVKVLNLNIGEREISGSFRRECEVLKRIRHRNLIKIITTCSKPDFQALVLPLMTNGNLDIHLYPPDGSSYRLSLVQMVSIASDIAEGIAYLHHYAPVKVVHCDLKPSNVLLDEDMTAIVSDFGIARLMQGDCNEGSGGNDSSASCISTNGLLHGSVGYIAPEYGYGSNPSTKGDVYSFGVIILEAVTLKRPTDEMFNAGLDLHKWVKSHLHGRLAKESPSTRPSMLDAADDLARLKRYLAGDTTATFASSLGMPSSTVGED